MTSSPTDHPMALSGLGFCALAAALVFQLCCGPQTICPGKSRLLCHPLPLHRLSCHFTGLCHLACSQLAPPLPHPDFWLSPHSALWSQPPCATHATPRPLVFTPHLAMWSWPLCATHPALFLWLCGHYHSVPLTGFCTSGSPGVSNFMCHPV